MNDNPVPPTRVSSRRGLTEIVPYLLGFTPRNPWW